MVTLAQNPPTKFKKILKSQLHDATSSYSVWTAF